MDRKTATVIGAAAALAGAPAMASPVADTMPVPPASSYADLLTPIPNAAERLRLADSEAGARPARLIEVQYHDHNHHDHHHHHVRHPRWWWLRHGYYWYGGQWVLRPRGHHHHHHHHHHSNDYGR